MPKFKLPTKPQPRKADPRLADVIDAEAAAAIAGVTQAAIRQAIDRGDLPAKKLGKTWAFSRLTVEAWAKIPRKPGPRAKIAS